MAEACMSGGTLTLTNDTIAGNSAEAGSMADQVARAERVRTGTSHGRPRPQEASRVIPSAAVSTLTGGVVKFFNTTAALNM